MPSNGKELSKHSLPASCPWASFVLIASGSGGDARGMPAPAVSGYSSTHGTGPVKSFCINAASNRS